MPPEVASLASHHYQRQWLSQRPLARQDERQLRRHQGQRSPSQSPLRGLASRPLAGAVPPQVAVRAAGPVVEPKAPALAVPPLPAQASRLAAPLPAEMPPLWVQTRMVPVEGQALALEALALALTGEGVPPPPAAVLVGAAAAPASKLAASGWHLLALRV